MIHGGEVVGALSVRIDVMESRVRIGERRLRKIFVDAPPSAKILGFELDRNARAAVDGLPVERALLKETSPFVIRGNRLPFPVPVKDFGIVRFRVDTNDKEHRRLTLRRFRQRFEGFACGEKSVHSSGADSDPLLSATHAQAMEFRPVKELSIDERNLLGFDPRPGILHAYAVSRIGHANDLHPYFG